MVPERLEDIRQSSSSFALEEGVEEHVVPVVLGAIGGRMGGIGDFKTSGDDTNTGKHAELVDELTTTSAVEINEKKQHFGPTIAWRHVRKCAKLLRQCNYCLCSEQMIATPSHGKNLWQRPWHFEQSVAVPSGQAV